MKKDLITTLEITDSWLKLSQLTGARGQGVVNCLGFKNIEKNSDPEISVAIGKLIGECKIKVSELILIIPRHHATLAQFRLPTLQDQELSQMVALQIVNSVPYAQEDIVYDYLILEKHPSGYTKVLALALHSEAVGRYLKILEKAGVHPKRITLSSIGCHQWYLFQRGKEDAIQLPSVLLLNFDDKHSEFCFCEHDKLVFSREVNFGHHDLEKPESLRHFLNQLNLTISNYKRSGMGIEIGHFLLVSLDPRVNVLAEALRQEFSLPATIVNPLDNISLAKGVEIPSRITQEGISLIAGLGSLLAPSEDRVNLFPKELKADRQAQQKKREWLTTATLGFFVLVLFSLGVSAKNFEHSKYLARIGQERNLLKKDLKEAQVKLKRFELIRDYLQNTPQMTDLLYDIQAMIPDGVILNVLDIDNKGVLTLEGTSTIGGNVNDLQESLVHSPRLKNVSLKYATKETRPDGGEGIRFSISCEINAAGEGA